uniref:SMP-LTD domain-containing protein n=1 Tax=Alexandrium monilatum TaxID=311494 RepID=A0A7S4S841_9DINO
MGRGRCSQDAKGATPRRALTRPPDRAPSFERMEWFESLLTALWPGIRGSFEQELRGTLEPKLQSKLPGLRFGSAYLGDSPPELRGARTRAAGDEVLLVFDLGFHPGSSIDISLVFGPLHAAICDLSVHGQLCVSLVRVVPRKPIVCGIRIYFANMPSISFNFAGLAKALPIPPQKIKDFLQEAIASKMVLPHSICMHLDSMARCFTEPDFLEYHALHSAPPAAVLRLRVASVAGRLLEELEPEGPSCLGVLQGRPPSVYALLRVGGQQRRTEPVLRERAGKGVTWPGELHDFIIDSLAEQDVHIELYSEDTARLVQCDELLAKARISAEEVAGRLSGSRPPLVRVGMVGVHRSGGDRSESCSAMLTGSLQPLSARPPDSWARSEALLLLSVDCVVGLAPASDGRKFAVRARILSEARGLGPEAATSAHEAGHDQVTEARVLHTAMEEGPLDAARDRLRLLRDRGARLSAEDAGFVLAGLVTTEQARALLEEIGREGTPRHDPVGCVEVLFGDQLRLPVGDPRAHGLRVELSDEDRGASVGVVEWSSLAFLTQSRKLEDSLQAYVLDPSVSGRRGTDAGTSATKIFLKRSLRVLGV